MAQAVNMRRLFLLSLLWAGPGCRGQRGEFLAMLMVAGRPCRGRQDSGLVVVTWEIIGVTCNVLLDLGENRRKFGNWTNTACEEIIHRAVALM